MISKLSSRNVGTPVVGCGLSTFLLSLSGRLSPRPPIRRVDAGGWWWRAPSRPTHPLPRLPPHPSVARPTPPNPSLLLPSHPSLPSQSRTRTPRLRGTLFPWLRNPVPLPSAPHPPTSPLPWPVRSPPFGATRCALLLARGRPPFPPALALPRPRPRPSLPPRSSRPPTLPLRLPPPRAAAGRRRKKPSRAPATGGTRLADGWAPRWWTASWSRRAPSSCGSAA